MSTRQYILKMMNVSSARLTMNHVANHRVFLRMLGGVVSRHHAGASFHFVNCSTTRTRRFFAANYYSDSNHSNNKVVSSAAEALELAVAVKSANNGCGSVPSQGAVVALGGFGLCGLPETLIAALQQCDKLDQLTIASITSGVDGFGHGVLLESTRTPHKVKRLISAYVGENQVLLLLCCMVLYISSAGFLYCSSSAH
jgi:hypothetical protein